MCAGRDLGRLCAVLPTVSPAIPSRGAERYAFVADIAPSRRRASSDGEPGSGV